MARSRSNSTHQRDAFTPPSLATLLRPPLYQPKLYLPAPTPVLLPDLEDRRQHRPDRATRPPTATRPGASRVKAKGLYGLRFEAPQYVAMCLRRKVRRQVLHALRKTKGGAGSRKHRNFWSNISC